MNYSELHYFPIEPIASRMQKAIASQMAEIVGKKRDALMWVVRHKMGMENNAESGRRITCLKYESYPVREVYYWDYGLQTEKFLLEYKEIEPKIESTEKGIRASIEYRIRTTEDVSPG